MEKKKTKVCDKEKYPSIEDELQLIKDIKFGGIERKTAIEKLSHSKLRFVVVVAKIFKGCGFSMEELINAGNEGLVLAAENYDESRGFKFMSYAVWWIRQSIIQNLRNDTSCKCNFAPLGLYCLFHFVSQALQPVLSNFAPPGLCKFVL